MIKKPELISDLIVDTNSILSGSGTFISVNDPTHSNKNLLDTVFINPEATGKPDQPLEALDASVSLSIDGASSSASIRLPEGTNIDGRAYIRMYTIQGEAGIFRTRSPKIGYGSASTQLQLEHAVNQIGDFIMDTTIQKEMTLEDALKEIFKYYKKKSGLWVLGSIAEPSDEDNEKCVLDVDYDNCLDAISGVMEQFPSLMLSFNFSTMPWRLNVKQRHAIPTAEGRLSRNVKSATIIRDDSDLVTRAYIDGYSEKGKFGYYTNDAAVAKYGLIEQVISGANDTPKIAKKTAKNYVKTHKEPRVTVTIDAIDLSSITGDGFDKLELGKTMRLCLPEYGETVMETITELNFPSVYKKPTSCTVTLNSEEDKVIKYIKKAQKSASRASRSAARISSAALVDAAVGDNVLTLTWGDGRTQTFSKAVTLEGTWSSGVHTVKAFQNNRNTAGGSIVKTQVSSFQTTLNGIKLQDGKTASVSGVYDMSIPLKVTCRDVNSGTYNTGYTQTITISAQTVYNKGWTLAYGKVSLPTTTKTSSNTITIKVPGVTVGQQVSRDYYIFNQSGNRNNAVDLCTSVNGTDVTVARYTHGKYDAGWGAAVSKIVIPNEGTSSSSFIIKVPSDQVGYDKNEQFTLYSYNNNNEDLRYWTGTNWITIARHAHNKYDAGWGAAYDKIVIPGAGTSSSSFIIKMPSDQVGYDTNQQFTLYSYDDNNEDVRYWTGTNWVTIARHKHNKYDEGVDDGKAYYNKNATIYLDSKTFYQGQWVFMYRQTVSQESQGIIQTTDQSRVVRWHTS